MGTGGSWETASEAHPGKKGIADPESRARVRQEISLLKHGFLLRQNNFILHVMRIRNYILYTFYMQ